MDLHDAWRELRRPPDADRRRAELFLAVAISQDAAGVARALRLPIADIQRWFFRFVAAEASRIRRAVDEDVRWPSSVDECEG